MTSSIKILFLGDVIGKPGRSAVMDLLKSSTCPQADLIVANVENAAHGFGVQEQHLKELQEAGVNIFTGGNHTFDRKEIFDFIDNYPNLLRPANYPEGTAGRGSYICEIKGCKVAILNLQGRVFMEPLLSPFLVADKFIAEASQQANIILVDIHAEATAEKAALAWYLDGKVSAVIGTHTHVQTADERILPAGTAYLTDAGCCGPINGVIGMELDGVLHRLIKQLPSRLEVARGPAEARGVLITIDGTTGKSLAISRIKHTLTGL